MPRAAAFAPPSPPGPPPKLMAIELFAAAGCQDPAADVAFQVSVAQPTGGAHVQQQTWSTQDGSGLAVGVAANSSNSATATQTTTVRPGDNYALHARVDDQGKLSMAGMVFRQPQAHKCCCQYDDCGTCFEPRGAATCPTNAETLILSGVPLGSCAPLAGSTLALIHTDGTKIPLGFVRVSPVNASRLPTLAARSQSSPARRPLSQSTSAARPLHLVFFQDTACKQTTGFNITANAAPSNATQVAEFNIALALYAAASEQGIVTITKGSQFLATSTLHSGVAQIRVANFLNGAAELAALSLSAPLRRCVPTHVETAMDNNLLGALMYAGQENPSVPAAWMLK